MSKSLVNKEFLNTPDSSEIGFVPLGTGAVTSTVQNKLRESVSVKDFGAVGDGVTDDTAAIQSALTYAGTLGNAEVVIPNGATYLFSTQLTIPSGVVLRGSGTSRLYGLLSNVIGTSSINITNGYYSAIENININHATPGSANTAVQLIDNDGTGSGTDPAQYFRMKGVRITNHETGVRIANESTWCVFEDVIATGNSGAAFSISNANFAQFDRCIADTNNTGWYLEGVLKAILNGCTAQVCASTTSAAINVLNSDGVEINHLWCERNGFHNVHVRGTSRMARITEMLNQGAGFSGSNGRGIFVDGTASNTIIDGGWHGGNLTEDITIGAATTNTVVINPRSTTTLTITDTSATSTHYLQGQIRFPSTINASSNTNTLDAYVEGNWTPNVIGTSTAGTPGYNSRVGAYTRIGDTVFFHCRINLASHTGTGNMVIDGLPFTAKNTTGITPSCTIGLISGLTLPASSIPSADIQPNTAQITLYSTSTAGGAVSSAALALDTSFVIEISGHYKV